MCCAFHNVLSSAQDDDTKEIYKRGRVPTNKFVSANKYHNHSLHFNNCHYRLRYFYQYISRTSHENALLHPYRHGHDGRHRHRKNLLGRRHHLHLRQQRRNLHCSLRLRLQMPWNLEQRRRHRTQHQERLWILGCIHWTPAVLRGLVCNTLAGIRHWIMGNRRRGDEERRNKEGLRRKRSEVDDKGVLIIIGGNNQTVRWQANIIDKGWCRKTSLQKMRTGRDVKL